MNNLDNPEILSDEIVDAIELIITQIPDAIFGGSIALNAVGLLNRKVSDIDVFFRQGQSLTRNGFMSIPSTEVLSDTVTDTNGNNIQRTGLKVKNIKVCAFKVSDAELQCSFTTFIRRNRIWKINIQNVNYAIQAKIAYANKNPKHKADLLGIESILNSI